MKIGPVTIEVFPGRVAFKESIAAGFTIDKVERGVEVSLQGGAFGEAVGVLIRVKVEG